MSETMIQRSSHKHLSPLMRQRCLSYYDNTMKLKTFTEENFYRQPEVRAYTLILKRNILQDSTVNRGEIEDSYDEERPAF